MPFVAPSGKKKNVRYTLFCVLSNFFLSSTEEYDEISCNSHSHDLPALLHEPNRSNTNSVIWPIFLSSFSAMRRSITTPDFWALPSSNRRRRNSIGDILDEFGPAPIPPTLLPPPALSSPTTQTPAPLNTGSATPINAGSAKPPSHLALNANETRKSREFPSPPEAFAHPALASPADSGNQIFITFT